MRFMMIIKANAQSEAGVMPSIETLTAMGRYNEELVKAGVLLTGEGLHPSAQGARLHYVNGKRTVVDGPFAEAKELVAGFRIIQVKSKAEAIEWMRRIPLGDEANEYGGEAIVELRQVFESEEFTTATPELIEQENRLRATVEARTKH